MFIFHVFFILLKIHKWANELNWRLGTMFEAKTKNSAKPSTTIVTLRKSKNAPRLQKLVPISH